MAGAVAFVFGLCAVSFAAGCALTVAVLRRGPAPEDEPVRRTALVEPEARVAEQPWPPEDYATRPIHRNPVLGIPRALPAQPRLSVVPDPEPERPVASEAVRRIHLVRDPPEPARHGDADPALVALDPVRLGPVAPEQPHAEPVVLRPVPPVEPEPEPGERAEGVTPDATTPALPVTGTPATVVVHLPAQADPSAPQQVDLPSATEFRERYLRAFEATRRRSGRQTSDR
ncbi:hypothetical protein [Saccharothrix sp. Mg75]|uniref:hypothetical protein n=1 Tax=Saccharothrix sp. Mg75 TaxID=3445357 RepID=UPI003EF059CD